MSNERDIILEAAKEEAIRFEDDRPAFKKTLILSGVRRKMLIWIYNRLVTQRKLYAIRDCPEDYKKELMDQTNEDVGDQLDEKGKQEYAKCIHTLACIITHEN